MWNDAMLFPSPSLTEQIFKIWLFLPRNYHSKQSSTRDDWDHVVVSQYKGKIFVCVSFVFNKFIFRDQYPKEFRAGRRKCVRIS